MQSRLIFLSILWFGILISNIIIDFYNQLMIVILDKKFHWGWRINRAFIVDWNIFIIISSSLYCRLVLYRMSSRGSLIVIHLQMRIIDFGPWWLITSLTWWLLSLPGRHHQFGRVCLSTPNLTLLLHSSRLKLVLLLLTADCRISQSGLKIINNWLFVLAGVSGFLFSIEVALSSCRLKDTGWWGVIPNLWLRLWNQLW